MSRDELCYEGSEDIVEFSSPSEPISDVVPANVHAQSVTEWVATGDTMANAGKIDRATEEGCIPVSRIDQTRSRNLGSEGFRFAQVTTELPRLKETFGAGMAVLGDL